VIEKIKEKLVDKTSNEKTFIHSLILSL